MKSKIWPQQPRKWPLDLNDLGRGLMNFFKKYIFKISIILPPLERISFHYGKILHNSSLQEFPRPAENVVVVFKTWWMNGFLDRDEQMKWKTCFLVCVIQIIWYEQTNFLLKNLNSGPYSLFTGKWIWDRSIYSIIKPSFGIILFQDFWRFVRNL